MDFRLPGVRVVADHGPLDMLAAHALFGGALHDVRSADLLRMFEAANWAPSAFNYQPWHFVYARRETPEWGTFLNLLVPGNIRRVVLGENVGSVVDEGAPA